jgi:peptidoglycan/xylan/chitin deacetylase (PgdA/CDA1 family)
VTVYQAIRDINLNGSLAYAYGATVPGAVVTQYRYDLLGLVQVVPPSVVVTLPGVSYASSADVTNALATQHTADNGIYGPISTLAGRRPTQTAARSGTRMVHTMQTGHNWTTSVVASSNLNDTSDFVLGSQCLSMVTDGAAGFGLATRSLGTARDYTGKSLLLWIKISDTTKLNWISLYAGSGGISSNNYMWRIYTGPLDLISNQWALVSLAFADVTTTTGSPNRAALDSFRLSVQDKGGSAPVTCWFNGIADFPEPATFPNGVVSFVFDDCYLSQYTEARKKLDQYGFAATAYAIANVVDTTGTFMTMDQMHRLEEYSGWEVAAHAYTEALHTAVGGYTALSPAVLDLELRMLKDWLMLNGFRGSDHYAYPQGLTNPAVRAAVLKYFPSARVYTNGLIETLPPADAGFMRSHGIANTTTVGAIETKIDHAFTSKAWDIITMHKVVTTATTALEMTIADFGTIVDYANTKGVAVLPVGDVLRKLV